MRARKSAIRHPSGVTLQTPLLVPSFSSKGFQFNKDGESEITIALGITSEVLYESMLISAYDLFHGHIQKPTDLKGLPNVVFLDSGGYETSDEHELSSVFRHLVPVKEWDESKLKTLLDSWPPHIPAVFVNFDHGSVRKPLKVQIASAWKLLKKYPDQLHDIILKPETKNQAYIQLPSVLSLAGELGKFHIIGFTEKELGSSILARMEMIARIRYALDEAKVSAPIHVFGSLDPISSCLYFLAGAEIFDGLTWLRYSYLNGMTVYVQNFGAVELDVNERDKTVRDAGLVHNLIQLRKLQNEMNAFLLDHDFNVFTHHSELLRKAYDSLSAKMGGRE